MKKIFLLVTALFWGIMCAFAEEYQETLYLKNGSVIKGVVIEQIPGVSLKMQTNDGSIFAYKMEDVEKITKEAPFVSSGRKIKGKAKATCIGYRGFVDDGYTFGVGKWKNTDRLEMTMSHGYQVVPWFYVGLGVGIHSYIYFLDVADAWFYVGLGVGIHYWTDEDMDFGNIPLFADFRADFLESSVTPFLDLKIGYAFGLNDNGNGFYCNPSVGVRFAVSSSYGINVGLGYEVQMCKIYYSSYLGDYYGWKVENFGGISLKVGMDF